MQKEDLEKEENIFFSEKKMVDHFELHILCVILAGKIIPGYLNNSTCSIEWLFSVPIVPLCV